MTRTRGIVALAAMSVMLLAMTGTAAAQEPTVTVDPSEDLADGDTLTATASGFPADDVTFVSGQCVTPIEDPLQQCDVGNIVPVPLDSNGEATFEITVSTGPIGTGTCGADGDACGILVGSLSNQEIFAFAPITFAPLAEDELALTGPSQLLTLSIVAVALMAGGVLLVARSNRTLRRFS